MESVQSGKTGPVGSMEDLEYKIQMLTTFIDSSEAGMYVTDYYTGEILFANRKMLTLGGTDTTLGEVMGKECWTLMNYEGEGRCAFCQREQLIDDKGTPLNPYTWEHYFPNMNLWLKIVSQAIIWADGRLAHMVTFYDITETKKMQERLTALAREQEHQKMQQSLQTVLDLLPMAVRIVELDSGDILYGNKAACTMFGESLEDATSKSVFSYMPDKQPNNMNAREKVERVFRDKPTSEEYICIKPNGERIDLLVTACVIDYNGKQASLGIMEDLAAEKEYRRMLENTAQKEREANQLKSTFLSNMSHEIRTPMNAVIGLTEIELHKNPPKDTALVYKKINASAKNLLQIVNDILDLSKIEADKMELFPGEFELEDVISSAMLVASPRLEGKNVELMLDTSLDLPRYVVGDRTRLWQVLKNYLDNAAKFTQEGSIVLSVAEDKVRSTEDTIFISFVIEDSGPGMDEDQLRKAELPYEQVYSETRKLYEGTGLGLPISRRICELMGGTLYIESAPGQGTRVRVTLPFSRSAQRELGRHDLGSLEGVKVLVVEDSALSLKVMETLLENSGAEYVAARSGAEALRAVRKRRGEEEAPFDVVVLDYVMQGMNGLETAKRIREGLSESSKLLLVTSYKNSLTGAELVACGIDDIIEKPYIPSQFVRRLRIAAGLESDGKEESVDDYARFDGARALVCEDNEINQEVVAGILEQFGVATVMASDGKRGLEILDKDDHFDLILMDLHMPVMDGYETAYAIRSDRRFDGIPIISLTADAMLEVADKCFAAGMDGFISKPIELDELYETLCKWLK